MGSLATPDQVWQMSQLARSWRRELPEVQGEPYLDPHGPLGHNEVGLQIVPTLDVPGQTVKADVVVVPTPAPCLGVGFFKCSGLLRASAN
jgi:hypothetical protein